MKMKHVLDRWFLCCCALLLCVGMCLRAEEETSEQEVKITADSMEMKLEDRKVELEGNVLIEDSNMSLTAKKMTVHLDKDNKLSNIEATGGVTVRKLASSESANGDSGVYDAKAELVTLRGNCVIMQGKRTVTGSSVVYNRKDGTIKLVGGTITLPVGKSDKGDDLLSDFLGNRKDTDKEKKLDEKKDEVEPKKESPAVEEPKN